MSAAAGGPARGAWPTPGRSAELDETVRAALHDEYELREVVGRGGMAVVYRARERALDRDVALKVLPLALAGDREVVERFQREARTAARLEHPHIVPIYRVGRVGPVSFFAMQLVRGRSLSALLAREGPLPPARVRRVLAETARALGYAHALGVVHRDVKPDNVLVDTRGRCVVTDFGIARSAADARLTGSGLSVGTPRYMSPEQARGREVDGRSDLYALGVIAYECLVGAPPFGGGDAITVMAAHATAPVPRPALPAGEARRLYAVVERLLAKRPGERFQSAEALLAALGPAAGGAPNARASGAWAPGPAAGGAAGSSVGSSAGSSVGSSADPTVVGAPALGEWAFGERAVAASAVGASAVGESTPTVRAGVYAARLRDVLAAGPHAAGVRAVAALRRAARAADRGAGWCLDVAAARLAGARGRLAGLARAVGPGRARAGVAAAAAALVAGAGLVARHAPGVLVAAAAGAPAADPRLRPRCPVAVPGRDAAPTLAVDAAGRHQAGAPLDVYVDVCGLAPGTHFRTRLAVVRDRGPWARLAGGDVPVETPGAAERATGPVMRRRHTLDVRAMPPGRYIVFLTYADQAGRRQSLAAPVVLAPR